MYVYGVVRQRATSTATTAGRLFVFCFAVFCLLTSTFCSREHFFKALQQRFGAPHSNISTEGLHFSVCRHSYTTLDICVDIGYTTGRHLLLSNILSLPFFALLLSPPPSFFSSHLHPLLVSNFPPSPHDRENRTFVRRLGARPCTITLKCTCNNMGLHQSETHVKLL